MLKSTIEKYEQGKELYITQELSLTQIAKILKIHRGRFAEYLKKQGNIIVNKQNENERFSHIFETINSEEKAYWLGFLYADGYVGSNTNHIELALQIDDAQHIQKFAEFINFTGKIQQNKIRIRISFRDKIMHNDLINLGCFPKKSLDLKFPSKDQVPTVFLKDFIRGYTDGDGYLGFSKRGKPRLEFTCGSEMFLRTMCTAMQWKEHKIYNDQRSNAKSLQYYGRDAYEILKKLYKDSNIYLDRKYKKFIEIENAVSSQMS